MTSASFGEDEDEEATAARIAATRRRTRGDARRDDAALRSLAPPAAPSAADEDARARAAAHAPSGRAALEAAAAPPPSAELSPDSRWWLCAACEFAGHPTCGTSAIVDLGAPTARSVNACGVCGALRDRRKSPSRDLLSRYRDEAAQKFSDAPPSPRRNRPLASDGEPRVIDLGDGSGAYRDSLDASDLVAPLAPLEEHPPRVGGRARQPAASSSSSATAEPAYWATSAAIRAAVEPSAATAAAAAAAEALAARSSGRVSKEWKRDVSPPPIEVAAQGASAAAAAAAAAAAEAEGGARQEEEEEEGDKERPGSSSVDGESEDGESDDDDGGHDRPKAPLSSGAPHVVLLLSGIGIHSGGREQRAIQRRSVSLLRAHGVACVLRYLSFSSSTSISRRTGPWKCVTTAAGNELIQRRRWCATQVRDGRRRRARAPGGARSALRSLGPAR